MQSKQERFERYWQQQKQSYVHFVSELIHNGILDIQEIQSIINNHLNAESSVKDENHATEVE